MRRLLAIALVALSVPAMAQTPTTKPVFPHAPNWRAPLPPPEYDHDYVGEQIIVTKWKDYNLIRFLCKDTKPPAVACSMYWFDGNGKPTSCLIMLGPNVWNDDRTYRHERGHCNGWKNDHIGAIP
jgi:hypothetical protein